MRAPLASLCFASIFAASASGAVGVPDMERGRALYENHCEVCHTSKVHSRINRLPIDIKELRQIVDNWQKEERLQWSPQDVEDVVQFLNRTRYNF